MGDVCGSWPDCHSNSPSKLACLFLQHFSSQSLPTPWAMNRNSSSHQPGPTGSARSLPDIAISQRRVPHKTILHCPAQQPVSCNWPLQKHNATKATTTTGHREPPESAPITSDVSGQCIPNGRARTLGSPMVCPECSTLATQQAVQGLSTHAQTDPESSPPVPESRILGGSTPARFHIFRLALVDAYPCPSP